MRKLLPGFIPLIILIIAGIVIAGAGGTYIVRKQFIKKGQSGKAALDEKKISQQLKNPVELESPSPEPTPQLAPVQYNYEPEKPSAGQNQQPRFAINPPSGWTQENFGASKAAFFSPDKDKEDAEPPLVYTQPANIQINLEEVPAGSTLLDAEKGIIEYVQSRAKFHQVISKGETSFANQDGRFYEFTAETEYTVEHVILYYTIKNNYLVQASGHALDSAWGKRVGVLKASIGSFKFTD
ncbi:MAG TPA: hypothetical protein VJC17_00530 [Candidatus Dojkabacteria bacterium]|nr:hypothetical protein [Candidatus Dojkabacteria bacterium]